MVVKLLIVFNNIFDASRTTEPTRHSVESQSYKDDSEPLHLFKTVFPARILKDRSKFSQGTANVSLSLASTSFLTYSSFQTLLT